MDNPREWHIYALVDPRTEAIRYVGWSLNPRQRLQTHCSLARHGGSYKYHWMKQLLALGLRPKLQILESGTGDYQEAERRWIAHYRLSGVALTNLTDGGDGAPGYTPSPETRARMAEAHRGKKQSAESTAKTRAALLGRKQSPEHVAKLAATRKGRAIPAATIAASVKNRGRKQSPEHVAKRIAVHVGAPSPSRKLSDEDVRSIRNSTESMSKLATRYNVGQTTIHSIKHRTKYRTVPDSP